VEFFASRKKKIMRRKALHKSRAVEIYKHKLALMQAFGDGVYTYRATLRGESIKISAKYGVSSRVVRDIWNHVTWKLETMHLWCHDAPNDSFRPEEFVLGPLHDPFHADWPYWE